ncbi:50S ribosomal protein L5, partial [Durusdinium trenchii]
VDAAALVDNPRQVAGAFRRDGLVKVKRILPADVAEAVCKRVHEELASRRAEGDSTYFGDVYGYEADISITSYSLYSSSSSCSSCMHERTLGSGGI